ncbi:major capsid protein [Halobacillus naozhouensis]|uniref:Major capsid protein n=1 Tax=Halobacillus naozhouensis TaxID=554880 RepID=A0ABY8J2E0_9BACI|nr:major capsid protein [Halobacillus naozhouensis]WFT76237.1 major capsid protein [Halobacillus naozhouensis]
MAGITHLEAFQGPALRALVDETERDVELNIADRFLPTEETFSRQFAYDIVKNNRYIAAYIGYGAEPPVMDRNAVASKMGEIAYFGLKDIVTYEELQAINEARNDDEQAAVIEKILIKNIDLLDSLRRLMFVAKMEALAKGSHSYNKNNVKYTFDFGIPAENKVALTSGNDFETPDFDIIGFLLEQVDAYANANEGKTPDVMWMSREMNAKLLKNSNIVLESGRPEGSTRVSQSELRDVLDSFGIPPIQIISERTTQVKDLYSGELVTIELLPVNRIVMLSEGIGSYLLGPTLENNFRPGLFLDAYDKKEPIQSVLRAVGAGFPAPEKPGLIFHIDAYTPA